MSQTSARMGRRTVAIACIAALGLTGAALGALSVTRTTRDRSFTLSARPASRTVAPGAGTRFTFTARQRRYRGVVRLAIVSRLPAGVSATLVRAGSARWRLIARTSASTKPGRYRLAVRAFRSRPPRPAVATPDSVRRWKRLSKGTRRITLSVRLVVTEPRRPFAVAGQAATLLTPGNTSPIDARVTNPNRSTLTLTSLGVAIVAVKPVGTGACTLADFASQPYSGPVFAVPARATRSLSQLGIPPDQWPRLQMLNRPVRQDGCKGAALTLSFTGSGRVER